MKIQLLLIALFFSLSASFAQIQIPQKTQRVLTTFSKIIIPQEVSENWVHTNFKNLPIYKVYGEYCLSMVAVKSVQFNEQDLLGLATVGSTAGNIITLKVPLKSVAYIHEIQNVEYLEIADRIAGMANHRMTRDTRVDSVWAAYNLPQAYTGKNVLIGITDWGFDYGHPMFMDTALTISRIRAAWDHFKLLGNQPTGFGYGVEYSTPEELAAAQSDTASTYYDYATHGSHVAGIAAGSGAGTIHRGVAFDAQFLFNSIQLDVGAAIDAFNWMKSIADADGKRLVINMSWGLYYLGTLDGTSLVSQAIDNLSSQGVVFVTSAGNNGDENFHIKKEFSGDTIRTRVEFYPYSAHPNMWGQSISSWGQPGEPYSIQVEINGTSTTPLVQSPIYSTNSAFYHDSILVVGNDTIYYNVTVEQAHPLNNRPMIWLRVKNTHAALKVVLKSFANTGTVHYWNVVELDNGVGNWGLPFTSYGVGGVSGDRLYGIGEPACTESAISVAAHASSNFNSVGTEYPGVLASFSSKGPTYDERLKPDVSAPGVSVISSINSFTTASYSPTKTIQFNGKSYDFAAFSGTSMSSPATAGVVALLLEANPDLSPNQIKEIVKSTARTDNKTGTIVAPGSTEWGMGKVTATTAIAKALNTVHIQQVTKSKFNIYPNPANSVLYIENNAAEPIRVRILTLDGKVVFEAKNTTNQLTINSLNKGMYLVQINSETLQETHRIVVL